MKTIYRLALALTLSWALTLSADKPPVPADDSKTAPVAPATPPPAVDAVPAVTPAPKIESPKAAERAAEKKATSSTEPASAGDGIVNANNVNVRGRASFIGEVITKLKKGEPVTVLGEVTLLKAKKGEPTKWLRIEMPANTPVWVHADFVDGDTKTVKATKLQVRAGPGENYSVVGNLLKGDAVKEIRKVDHWMEIETPPNCYAFVAADMIERTGPTAPVVPEPVPEVVTVPPDVSPETPAPAEPTPPVTTEPAPAPPVVVPPPVVEEPLPKRIVTREGTIRRSLNVQTPSYFALESPDTGKVINYLYSSEPTFTLKSLVGARVIVTGEESIDRRWPNTPVIEIETLEQR